jgi:hypothetical protein
MVVTLIKLELAAQVTEQVILEQQVKDVQVVVVLA